jgi:hypothetical protein
VAIIIKDWFSVGKYIPAAPTYVIRILNLDYGRINNGFKLVSLVNSDLFKKVNYYKMDDSATDSTGKGPILEDVARKIIRDFSSFVQISKDKGGIEDILIHCVEGKSRSPAVGGALNEIFGLGYVHWRISVDFPGYNVDVYKQLIRVAKEMKIVFPVNRNILYEGYNNA